MLSSLRDEPVLKELRRRAVAQRGVAAPPVIERCDVLEQVGFGLCTRRVAGAVDPFVLQAVEEALRGRVVPAIALRLIEAVMAYCVSLSRMA